MSDRDNFTDEVISRLREQGIIMLTDDFIDQLIMTLHENVNAINIMQQLADLTGGHLSKEIKELSTRIADIAFSIEGVRNEQQP